MPELARLVVGAGVEFVFEGRVAVVEFPIEGCFGAERGEVEGRAGVEDYGLRGEVAVCGVVETVYVLSALASIILRSRPIWFPSSFPPAKAS